MSEEDHPLFLGNHGQRIDGGGAAERAGLLEQHWWKT